MVLCVYKVAKTPAAFMKNQITREHLANLQNSWDFTIILLIFQAKTSNWFN